MKFRDLTPEEQDEVKAKFGKEYLIFDVHEIASKWNHLDHLGNSIHELICQDEKNTYYRFCWRSPSKKGDKFFGWVLMGVHKQEEN